jgi:hypothetical protein
MEVVVNNLHQEVTDSIIAALEAGASPWIKPWSATSGLNVPSNAITGRPYSGPFSRHPSCQSADEAIEGDMPSPASASIVLGRMRREHLDLYCQHDRRRGRIVWHLADGTEVPAKLAHELVRRPNIKPAGDVLPFGKGERLPCQTYRFHI